VQYYPTFRKSGNEKRGLRVTAESAELQISAINNEADKVILKKSLYPIKKLRKPLLKTILSGFISKVTVRRIEKTIQGMVLFYNSPKFEMRNHSFL
jgi:hypothetical protein